MKMLYGPIYMWVSLVLLLLIYFVLRNYKNTREGLDYLEENTLTEYPKQHALNELTHWVLFMTLGLAMAFFLTMSILEMT